MILADHNYLVVVRLLDLIGILQVSTPSFHFHQIYQPSHDQRNNLVSYWHLIHHASTL